MNHRNVLIYFAIVIFVSIGPIFNNLPIKLLFVLLTLLVYVLLYRPMKNARGYLYFYLLLLLFLITTTITCVVNETAIPFIFSVIFTIASILAIQFEISEIRRLVELLTVIFKYVIILAWIGYFYSLFGRPLFSLSNPNGASNYFYLTTFSINSSPIRPSGFYDEPGAFSLFICLLVFFRTYLGLDLRMSIFLLLGGIITQSLAHAVFLLVWIVSILFTKESKVRFSFIQRIFTLAFICVVTLLILKSGILDWAIDRTMYWSEDPDSIVRVKNYNNVLDEISGNTHNLLFGFNKASTNRADSEGLSENVLTPIAMGGLFASWPFYLFLGFCFLYPLLTFKNFSLIAIGLLILQRPYFLELPYSFCLSLIIALFIGTKVEGKYLVSHVSALKIRYSLVSIKKTIKAHAKS